MDALTFRLLSKDEAMEVYEYLDYSVQERLIEKLKSQEVRDIVDQMSSRVLEVIDQEAMSDDKPKKRYARALLGGMLGAIATV